MIDSRVSTHQVAPVCTSCEVGGDKDVRAAAVGLSPPHLWKMYRLSSVPGTQFLCAGELTAPGIRLSLIAYELLVCVCMMVGLNRSHPM